MILRSRGTDHPFSDVKQMSIRKLAYNGGIRRFPVVKTIRLQ